MMRRITVVGSVLLASSVIAAMGLAQNGIRPPRTTEAGSLADRLTALRQSMTATAEDAGDEAAEPSEQSGTRGHLSRDPRGSRSMPRTALAEPAPAERPRRPRLLSQLDPLNLLSLGDAESDGSSQEAPSHAAAPAQSRGIGSRQGLREMSSSRRGGESGSPGVQAHRTRRSPLIRASEEAATPAEDRKQGTAVGPGASASIKLPSLNRPVGNSLPIAVAEKISEDSDSDPTVLPPERPLEDARQDSSTTSSDTAPRTDDSQASVLTGSENDMPAHAASAAARYGTSRREKATEALDSAAGDDEGQAAEDRMASRPYRRGSLTASSADAQADDHADSSDEGDAVEAMPNVAVETIADNRTHAASTAEASGTTSAAPSSGQILSSHAAPSVAWEVAGPEQIIIGRESTFEVRLRNEGDQAVERLVARIEVPASAEILSAESSHGVGQRVENESEKSVLEWRVDRLSAARESVLKLAIVPHSSHTMNLEISVRSEPRAALARVEVLEPKIQLALEGPSDVLHGEARTYRITVYNPGTGPAENVNVLFTPPGEEEAAAQNHPVGLLKPGERKTIELEVTPQVAGNVAISALATAEGDLRDHAERQVLVRKPELVVDVRGPRTTYAGTTATYYFRLRNTGDAIANDVVMQAHLPLGAELVRASDDRRVEPKAEEDSVIWDIGALPPGEELYMELKCIVSWAGDNTLEISAEGADGKLQHTKPITTHVVALADLKLEVADPKGPVAVGKEALYEVRIRNRGSNTAEAVNVVALFSEGVDPVGVEGGQHAIENGRVAFRTIESLPAGREIVFKIKAVAKQPGTHVFRAEVLCRELETKLAAEETTRFFLDESGTVRADGSLQSASRADIFQSRK